MNAHRPYSIKIFLPGGDPNGLRTLEKSNWSGSGLVVPRSLFGEAKQRKELTRTGVYVLVGPPEESGLPRIYIGEGDPIRPRLEQHASKKDFWTHAAVFTSKDQNLNKAHVQYIEARLIALASDAKRCELDNGNVPQPPALSEADAADAEGFLADLLLCLPVVGGHFFEKGKAPEARGHDLLLKAKGIEAHGIDGAEGFVVRAGSTAVKAEVPSIHPYLVELRRVLLKKGVLTDSGDTYRLAQDYTFDSPSTAAGVLLGRSANGRIEWTDAEGRSLKRIQEAAEVES